MRSLKGTLYRGVILGAAVVLFVAGTILYLSVSAQLVRQMDVSLADKARTLALSVEVKHYGLEVDTEEMRTEAMEEADTPEYVYIGTLNGRIIYRSEGLEGIPVPSFAAPLQDAGHDWNKLPDGRKLRSSFLSFLPAVDDEFEDPPTTGSSIVDSEAQPGEQFVIQLFKDSSDHFRFMETFLLMLLATGLGSIGILSFSVWWTINRGAEPINDLASRIEAIKDDDLAVRLDETRVLTELTPIVYKMNLFLDRLEGSFNRERGFTSDAAHELRTPLAGLKSTIEVALARKRQGDEYRDTLESSLRIVNQLENLVKSLLALARLESGQEKAKKDDVLLESCIRDAWSLYSDQADERRIGTVFDTGNGDMAAVDKDLFIQVLEELFKNAVYYADEGGAIAVSLKQERGNVRLRVSNTGSKVRGEESSCVFDRFWRGSHFRDDTGMRFGLGLPIVKKIVDTMGMRIEVQSEMDEEFVVTLTLPESQPQIV